MALPDVREGYGDRDRAQVPPANDAFTACHDCGIYGAARVWCEGTPPMCAECWNAAQHDGWVE